MLNDVDDVAVGCSDEEPPHAPWLRRERVDDLVASPAGLLVGALDVSGVDGDGGDLDRSGIAGHELDVRSVSGEV